MAGSTVWMHRTNLEILSSGFETCRRLLTRLNRSNLPTARAWPRALPTAWLDFYHVRIEVCLEVHGPWPGCSWVQNSNLPGTKEKVRFKCTNSGKRWGTIYRLTPCLVTWMNSNIRMTEIRSKSRFMNSFLPLSQRGLIQMRLHQSPAEC